MKTATRWYQHLYIQVLIGIVIGGLLGYFIPGFAAKLQPLADGFIKLIKMLLAPIIFGTVVVGIAKMGSIKEVGRIGGKARFPGRNNDRFTRRHFTRGKSTE